MKVKPVIKWSGSKSKIAEEIANYIPEFNKYYEPFIGGGSVLYAVEPTIGKASDINKPLIDLWNLIKNNPTYLSDYYEKTWKRMDLEGADVYYQVRDKFNSERTPEDLMFLSRTCVNGLARFNQKGEFNNSLHYSRKGIKPSTLRAIIDDWSNKIQKIEFTHEDYKDATKLAREGDFIYLDPPYFNTKGRYYGLSTIDFDEFYHYLEDLNQRKIKFALSFDGYTDEKEYEHTLPEEIYKRHVYLETGNSSFQKVMNKKSNKVFESLYLNY